MSQDWYQGFFDQRYLQFYPVLLRQRLAPTEAAVVAHLLELPAGAALLDLGCGTGRHSVALAQLGYRVTGLDLSPELLAVGRETAAAAGVQVHFLQRDMRELADLGPFDACLSLYTAFGFLGDAEDAAVLRGVAAALRPGGQLLLDLSNFLGYLLKLPRELWRETEEALLREQNQYQPETGLLITRRTCFWKKGGRLDLPDSRVRAYFPHEVRALLAGAGLQIERVLGALSEQPFDWDSSPCQVYLCRKPLQATTCL